MSSVLRLLRWAARLPLIRKLTSFKPLLRVSFGLRGLLVQQPVTFARRELAGGGVGCYRLRGSAIVVCVRHRTPDVLTLDEIFAQRVYELPPRVRAALDASGPLRLLDLGANIGLFGAYLLARYPDAVITAFEPDPANSEVHRMCIGANGRETTWKLVEACAWNQNGSLPFTPQRYALSQIAGPEEPGARETTAVDVFPYLSETDAVKLDIEGGEWSILGDSRFASAAPTVLVMEYHRHLCPGEEPRRTAIDLLERAGYAVERGFESRSGEGTLWAVKDPG